MIHQVTSYFSIRESSIDTYYASLYRFFDLQKKTIQASSQNRRGDQTIIVINEPPSIENNEENQNENRPVSNIRKQLLLAFLGFWYDKLFPINSVFFQGFLPALL